MTIPFENSGSGSADESDSEIVRRVQEQIDSDESKGLNVSRNDDDVEICVRLLQHSASVIFFPIDTDDTLVDPNAPGLPDTAPVNHKYHGGGLQDGFTPPTSSQLGLEFVRVLGTGGFGVVLAVQDTKLRQQFAIKILRPSLRSTSKLQKRFLREAELTADFRHAGIVRVLGTGLIENHPFILTELIDGQNVADLLRNHGPTLMPTAAVKLMLRVCQAIRYAHDQGVLHRDLKPENILLANRGTTTEDIESYVPLLTDFGLARRIEAATGESSTHTQIVGTILYMAPELATGQRQSASVTCDIFSLAAILYQCVTGRVPFEGKGYFEIISKMVHATIPSARKLNPNVTIELDFVLQKALSRRPGQRYQTAAEFEAELQRVIEGKPVTARQGFLLRQVKRLLNDHPRLAIATGVLVVIVPIAFIVISVLYWRERNAVLQHREMLAVTMNSVKEYTNIAEDVLADVPASSQQRYDLHWRALKAQEAVARGLGFNAESRYRLSVQYSYLAAAAIPLNKPDLMRQHLEKCLVLLRELAQEDPDNTKYLYDIFYNQKCAADNMWHRPAADRIAAKEQSLIEIRRLRARDSVNPDFEDAEASCIYFLAIDYVTVNDPRAEQFFLEAISISEKLFRSHPQKLLYVKYALLGRADLSDLYREAGRPKEAEEVAAQAMALVEQIALPEKDTTWFLHIRREPLRAYADSLAALKKWALAAAAWQSCLTIEDSLYAHYPDNTRFVLGRCTMYVERLRALRKLGLDSATDLKMVEEAQRRLEVIRRTNSVPEEIPGIEAAIQNADAPLTERVR